MYQPQTNYFLFPKIPGHSAGALCCPSALLQGPSTPKELPEDSDAITHWSKLPHHDNLLGGLRCLRCKPSKTPSSSLSTLFGLLPSCPLSPMCHPRQRAQWSNSLTSQPMRLRSREERGLAQGHTTSQTRTPGPIFPAPGRHHHSLQAISLLSKGQDRKEAAWLWRLPRASLIGWGPRSYGPPWRASCDHFTKTCLIRPPLASELISPPLPLIHSAPATVTFFQPQGLCTLL